MWFGSEDASAVAAELTRERDLEVPDITREELIEIVRRLTPTDELFDAENEPYWVALFEANTPRPNAANLIYYPPDDHPDDASWKPTPAQVVDLALSYRAIEL